MNEQNMNDHSRTIRDTYETEEPLKSLSFDFSIRAHRICGSLIGNDRTGFGGRVVISDLFSGRVIDREVATFYANERFREDYVEQLIAYVEYKGGKIRQKIHAC